MGTWSGRWGFKKSLRSSRRIQKKLKKKLKIKNWWWIFVGLWNVMCTMVMYVHPLVTMVRYLEYVVLKIFSNFSTRLQKLEHLSISVGTNLGPCHTCLEC